MPSHFRGSWRCVVGVVIALTGCHRVDDVADCDELEAQDECEDADPDHGECRWVEILVADESSDACPSEISRGACVGFSGTQAGCAGYACPGASTESPSFFYRPHGTGSIELFVSPVCGPEPYGEWEPCVEGGSSLACVCGCGF